MSADRPFLSRLSFQSFWYTLANVVAKFSGLLLLPLFTNTDLFSVEQFGLLGILEVSVQISVAVFSLQIGSAIIQFAGKNENEIVGSAWISSIISGLSGSFIVFSALYFIPNLGKTVALWLALQVFAEIQLHFALSVLRSRGKAQLYSLFSSAKILALTGFLFYQLSDGRGLEGVVFANALINLLFAIIAVITVLSSIKPQFSSLSKNLRQLISYSSPLIIASLSSLLLNAGDKYLLLWLSTPEELGLYSMATRFSGLVNMLLVQSFLLAWHPLLSVLSESQRPQEIIKVYRLFPVALVLLSFGVAVSVLPVLQLLQSDPIYFSIRFLLLPLCFGFVCFGLSAIEMGILLVQNQSKTVSRGIGISIVMNAMLNAMAIPFLGAHGAAAATFVSYLFLWLYLRNQRQYMFQLIISTRKFWLFSGVVAGIALLILWFSTSYLLWNIGLAAAGVALFPVLVYVFKMISPDDLRAGLKLLGLNK